MKGLQWSLVSFEQSMAILERIARRVLCAGPSSMGGAKMLIDKEEGIVVYSMTIRTKSGKVIRRADGKPFRFVVKNTKPKQ
jgi:hypothetical protein